MLASLHIRIILGSAADNNSTMWFGDVFAHLAWCHAEGKVFVQVDKGEPGLLEGESVR